MEQLNRERRHHEKERAHSANERETYNRGL